MNAAIRSIITTVGIKVVPINKLVKKKTSTPPPFPIPEDLLGGHMARREANEFSTVKLVLQVEGERLKGVHSQSEPQFLYETVPWLQTAEKPETQTLGSSCISEKS